MANQEREREAFRLRVQGKTLQAIADELGFAVPSSAARAIERHLAANTPALDTERYRNLQLMRLEQLHAALWPMAIGNEKSDPDLAAGAAILRIHDRLERLLGLNREPVVDIEAELRRAARAEGLDEDEVVAEARGIIRTYEPRWARGRLRSVS